MAAERAGQGQSKLLPHQEHMNTLVRGVNNNQREPCINAAVFSVRVCVCVSPYFALQHFRGAKCFLLECWQNANEHRCSKVEALSAATH